MPHHAYYREGPLSEFEAHMEALKPFWAHAFERFGVDEARELIALASLKNFEEAVFLVGCAQITTEAQQALLKLLEEPQQGTTFVFVVPHGTLLPTVRSRMMEWEPQENSSQKVLGSASVSAKDIPELIKSEDKEQVRAFLDAMEHQLRAKINDPKARAALQDIAMVRDYLRDRSPSLKMLLEHLALSLPTF